MNTYYGYFVIGTLTHVFFASMVNHGTPLCYCNNSLLSVLIHSIVGMVFSRFTYNFKRNLLSSYRDGLVVNYRYLEHYRSPCVTRVLFESRWSLLLIKSCENLIFTSLVAFASVYMYSMFSTPVYIADTCSKYIFIKLIALLYVVSGDLGNLIANICLYTICFFSRIFEADNYLFNKPFPLVDKSRLVWDANVKTEVAILKRKAREINNRLAYHRKSGSGDQQISVSESASDGLQEIEDTMSSRIESTLLPSVKTSRKLRKIDEDEKKFLKKYSVNDKKIEKYYCKTHKGKFSLFYYPRYFPVFVFFTILSCIISGTGFLYSLFFISHYFTGLVIPGNSFVFGVFFISASRLVAAFASNRQQSIFLYVKQLFLVFFTNILWPGILAALYICFYYDNSALIRVSELFVSFWAFSFILHHCVVRIMGIRSFSDGYTVYKFIRGLVSLTALGSTIICSVLICRRYFDFNSLVLVISSIFFAYYTALFLGELVSGTWFEKIRDKYFLKEVAVADYEICSE
ncbi:hypothetical protein PAEPH01_1304 [Pancytospora epiphaga]|nr:hypothetical protein PAEPH01_1304 [Pancytospora epiphaga]